MKADERNRLSFAEMVKALAEFEGMEVLVIITGPADPNSSIATLAGRLFSLGGGFAEHLAIFDRVEGVEAVSFRVGDAKENRVNIWPDRFLGAERLTDQRGVEIKTKDAVVRIELNRPWID